MNKEARDPTSELDFGAWRPSERRRSTDQARRRRCWRTQSHRATVRAQAVRDGETGHRDGSQSLSPQGQVSPNPGTLPEALPGHSRGAVGPGSLAATGSGAAGD
eukprot:3520167-Rhodomonas_salina.1